MNTAPRASEAKEIAAQSDINSNRLTHSEFQRRPLMRNPLDRLIRALSVGAGIVSVLVLAVFHLT